MLEDLTTLVIPSKVKDELSKHGLLQWNAPRSLRNKCSVSSLRRARDQRLLHASYLRS